MTRGIVLGRSGRMFACAFGFSVHLPWNGNRVTAATVAEIWSGGVRHGSAWLGSVPGSREHPAQGERRLVFKGTRLPVATVIENLEDLSIDEVIEQFDVTREQVTAVLEFVAQSLRSSDVPAGARPL